MRRVHQVIRGSDRGMSLIEVVIAVVILALMSTAILGLILKTQSAGVGNRARIAAASLAAREIDMVRDEFGRKDSGPMSIANAGEQTNPHPRDGQVAGAPFVVDGTSYTVTRTVKWNYTAKGQSACTGGSLLTYPTLAVSVSVTWPNMGVTNPVVSTAALAPAPANGIPGTTSFIAVAVLDNTGAPNAGRTVKVTGGGATAIASTDDSGCAVVAVTPVAGTGTMYTAQLTDAGYVDITGATAPSKPVGIVTQGQLSSGLKFGYAKAGSVTVRLVDGSTGSLLDPGVVGASQVTTEASESGGSNGKVVHTINGVTDTLSNLWPTQYTVYYGTTAPVPSSPSINLGPGATASIDLPVAMASASLVNLPPGTKTVTAIPGSTADCAAPNSITVTPAGFKVLPGTWSFMAHGDGFVCAPGPNNVGLGTANSTTITWGTTGLKVTGAPAGKLWAVSASKVTNPSLATCPSAADTSTAVDITGATTGQVAMPAGSWYVYLTSGAASATCVGVPGAHYPEQLGYGVLDTIPWSAPPFTLNSSGMALGYSFMVTTTQLSGGSCSNSTYTPPASYVTSPAATTGSATLSVVVTRPPAANVTWYAYSLRTAGSPRCTAIGKYVVGPSSLSPMSKTSAQGSVGP